MALGASGWIALKVVMAAVSAAAIALSTLWLLRVATFGTATFCALLLALLPGTIGQTHMVLSEIPFWGFVMLALWAFARYESREGDRAVRWLAVAGAATAAAWLTRSAGVALAVALVARLALLRRWRDGLLLGGIATVPAALWWLRGRLLAPHGYSEYLLLQDPYRPELGRIGAFGLVPRALENAGSYLFDLGPRFIAGAPAFGHPLAVVLLALAAARWGWLLVRRRGAPELWLLFYGGLVLIWPQSWAGERFLVPLAPVLLYYAVDGVRVMLAPLAQRRRRPAAGAAALLALAAVISGTEHEVRLGIECRSGAGSAQPFPCTPSVWRELFEVARLARGRLPADAVVIARKPTLFWELSGYRSTTYPWSDDPAVFFAKADSVGAAYVVLDRSPETAQLYLVPVLEARASAFCVIPGMSSGGTTMMRIDPAGARALGGEGGSGAVRFRTCESPS